MSDNPKVGAATRDKKAPLDLLERRALEETARAMQDGARKYGKMNYRTVDIYASTYGAAIMRHVLAWLDGEDNAPDSGFHHLAHIAANINVMFGAMEAGTFKDDRGPQPRTPEQEARSAASNQQHAVRADEPESPLLREFESIVSEAQDDERQILVRIHGVAGTDEFVGVVAACGIAGFSVKDRANFHAHFRWDQRGEVHEMAEVRK